MADNDNDKTHIQGEGDYESARKFDADERSFIKSNDVEQLGKNAEEALDGPEGEELERARRETGERGGMEGER